MNSISRLLVVLGLVVGLAACQTVKHFGSVEARSSLTPDKCYVGGTYQPPIFPVSYTAYLYLQSADAGIVALTLPAKAGLFLAELPAGHYRVDHLSFQTVDWKWVNLGVPELSGVPFEAIPAQVTNVGSMTVESTYMVLVTTYRMRYSANPAFGERLRQEYDVPASVSIVDVTK